MLLPYLEHIGRCEGWKEEGFPRSSSARQASYARWRSSWSASRVDVPQQGSTVACGALAGHNTLRFGASWGVASERAYQHRSSDSSLSKGMCLTVRERLIYEVKTGTLLKGFGSRAECIYSWPR